MAEYGIDPGHFRGRVVRPVLHRLGLYSDAAENLLVGTAAQESLLGRYLVQVGGGPALGVFQMEPATHRDIWENFLAYRPELVGRIKQLLPPAAAEGWRAAEGELVTNLAYAAAMCRVHYLRRPEPLPKADDLVGLAAYWKRFYNTEAGAGTVDEFYMHYPGGK